MARRSAESHPAASADDRRADRHGLCRSAASPRPARRSRLSCANKELAAKVVALPFVPHRYIRG